MKFDIPKSTLLYDINHYLFGDRGCLQTDYARLKGNADSDMGYSFHWISEIESDYNYDESLQLIFPDDGVAYYPYEDCGVRPTIDYDFLVNNGVLIEENKKYVSNDYMDLEYNGERSCSLYQYGEYPQTRLNEEESKFIESMYFQGRMYKTGNYYSYSSSNVDCERDEEFEFEGKRYVRAKIFNNNYWYRNENKNFIIDKEYMWVKVEPIIWFVDIKSKICISKNIIIGPTQYNDVAQEDIDGTYIEKYLNEYFSKEITGQYRVDIEEQKKEYALQEWLDWSNENFIHPVIHMFMFLSNGKYLDRIIDWKVVSDSLYISNNIFNLVDILDDDIYKELSNLYQSINVSISDVLSGNVNKNVLNSLSNVNKYLLISLLTLVSEKDYECVSDFIRNNLNKKYLEFYDKLYNQCLIKKESCILRKEK